MNNYKAYLETELKALYTTLSSGTTPTIPSGYKINVIQELSFGTEDESEKKTITFVLKVVTGSVLTNSVVYPVQIMVFSEVGSVEYARTLIDTFAKNKSMTTFSVIDNSTNPATMIYYKQMYSTSVIMSNFNRTPDGLRSMLFLGGTVVVTKNINDISYITIRKGTDTATTIKFMSFAFTYTVTPDSQRVSGEELNVTKKKLANQMLSFTTNNLSSQFFTDVYNIASGSLSGNTAFEVKLYRGTEASPILVSTFSMILLDYSLTSTPNELPILTIRLGK
jgi:hypothetical protein